tara:strand:+ start:168 stop:788 length:621 start_codon:yes stop_codon:yes gene_type:complete
MFGALLVINSLQEKILNTIENEDFVKDSFPMMTDWGIKDDYTLIHSLGCSYWMQLGHYLGYSGVVEVPAPLTYAIRSNHDVRSDAVWFDKETQKPNLVVEFERYSGTNLDQIKLTDKVKNLLLAHRRWALQPDVVALAYWTNGLKTLPNHQRLKELFEQGFKLSNGEFVEGNNSRQLLLLNFVFQSDKQGKHRLVDVVRRGQNGEV